MKLLVTCVVLAALSPALACGGDKPPVKAPDTAGSATPSAGPSSAKRLPPNPPDSPQASAVRISDEIVKACGINEPDAYFAFDSSNVRPDDANVLGQLATCFTTGPLKGREMKLVGHADPRGSGDYNMTLGQSRADSVKDYLLGHGMDKSKTDSSTRGAMDATGTDDPSWARDRRVDILLGQ
jgi:peptidoglycan-associated lipoprotein